MPAYVYEPLRKGHIRHKQCIRLVELLPGSKHEKIRIHIIRTPVEGRSYPVYEALSYCWGDKTNPQEVEVVPRPRGILHRSKLGKDGSDHTTLKITANLASALIHLRRQDTVRVLWIDAICLDQENEAEKTLELGKMGSIYIKAKNVVVWLGPGSDDTAQAFRAMTHLGHQVQWVAEKNELITAKTCDEAWKDWRSESFVVPFDHKTWLAIEGVILSEWFRRVWIWQEICLANHATAIVQCGPSVMSWNRFLNAIAFFDTDPTSGAVGHRESFEASLKEVANLALIQPSRHLLGLLGVTRRCNCTDPKDRIYGPAKLLLKVPSSTTIVAHEDLLGLATQENEDRLLAYLKPDYEKRPSQVYKDFAAGEIEVMRRLSILWHCDAEAWSSELPSWVPAWDKKLPYENLNLGVFGGGRGALGLKDRFGTISKDVLTVYGVICGTVTSCSAVMSKSVEVSEMSSVIRSWVQRTTFGAGKPLTENDEQTLVALCHAITAGYIGKRYPDVRWPANLQATKDIIKYILASNQVIKSSSDIPFPDEPSLAYHIANTLPHRRFFRTGTGQIGLGPLHAQPGDQVVSIIGSKQLMLLRADPPTPTPTPTPDGRKFKIVGLCYLYGFMDLEAILGPLPEGYSVRLVGSCNDPWDMRFLRHGDDESELSPHDPRLERSYEGWKSNRKRESDGAVLWDYAAGRIATTSDPRHTDLGFLRGRGVPIREICIV